MSTTTPTTSEPTAKTEPVVEQPEQTMSTQIVDELAATPTPAVNEETTEAPAAEETAAATTETKEEVSTAVVPPTTEETPAATSKPTVNKRRSIFYPFGKAPKKTEEEVTATTEDVSAAVEEKTKKASKGFGTFFSRSKVK